jgi:UDP-N-acetylglucosamine--N-acetylmuramyl-(pentapeptide) pyrophosphoryl-undecaprenol N-acetylglucosamine transferase
MSPNTHERTKVILAAGGTGGHIYPGVALAKEFISREDMECLMVMTSKPLDRHIVENEGLPFETLPVKGMSWGPSWKTVVNLFRFAMSFPRAWRIISSYTPDMIIGLGAYVSFPLISMGRIRGITTFIHEQNLLPGRANLFLGRWVDGIFTSFPETAGFFPKGRVKMLGNPLRPVPSKINRKTEREKLGLKPDLFTLLVFGGSLGAHAINIKSMEAFKIMKSMDIPFQVIHQTGQDDYEEVAGFYKKEKIPSHTSAYFDHMIRIYLLADLVICRSGAGTISELTVTGRPAILIPYPSAKADHQRMNAQPMVSAGAARMIVERDLTGELLAGQMTELLKNPELLEGMARSSIGLGRPHAAKSICDQAVLWYRMRGRRENAS